MKGSKYRTDSRAVGNSWLAGSSGALQTKSHGGASGALYAWTGGNWLDRTNTWSGTRIDQGWLKGGHTWPNGGDANVGVDISIEAEVAPGEAKAARAALKIDISPIVPTAAIVPASSPLIDTPAVTATVAPWETTAKVGRIAATVAVTPAVAATLGVNGTSSHHGSNNQAQRTDSNFGK